jgi:hypothetical protein
MILVGLAAACAGASPAESPPSKKGVHMSTRELVQKWAGPERRVFPWSEVKVPGVELFTASSQMEYIGVAMLPGATTPLTGKEALRACIDRGISDATQLATLTMHLLEFGGEPLTDPQHEADEMPAAELALAHPPRVKDGVLEYWRRDKRGKMLIRGRLDLKTLEHSFAMSGVILQEQQKHPSHH